MALTNRNIINSMRYIFLLLFGVLLFSCNSDRKLEKEIQHSPMDGQIVRFDEESADASPADLPVLKQRCPEFFPVHYHDSLWVQKLADTLQTQLEDEVFKVF